MYFELYVIKFFRVAFFLCIFFLFGEEQGYTIGVAHVTEAIVTV